MAVVPIMPRDCSMSAVLALRLIMAHILMYGIADSRPFWNIPLVYSTCSIGLRWEVEGG